MPFYQPSAIVVIDYGLMVCLHFVFYILLYFPEIHVFLSSVSIQPYLPCFTVKDDVYGPCFKEFLSDSWGIRRNLATR